MLTTFLFHLLGYPKPSILGRSAIKGSPKWTCTNLSNWLESSETWRSTESSKCMFVVRALHKFLLAGAVLTKLFHNSWEPGFDFNPLSLKASERLIEWLQHTQVENVGISISRYEYYQSWQLSEFFNCHMRNNAAHAAIYGRSLQTRHEWYLFSYPLTIIIRNHLDWAHLDGCLLFLHEVKSTIKTFSASILT